MTTKEKYNQLTADQQKRVNREVSEIKQAGQNAFWLETGLHADNSANYWSVVAYAMAATRAAVAEARQAN